MKKLVLSALAVASMVPSIVMAHAAPEEAAAHTLTGNAGVYTDYRFRGISQTTSKTEFNTLEGYRVVGWKFISLKYSNTLADYFGVNSVTFGGACNRDGADCFGANPGRSRRSGYLDLTASYEIIPKLTLVGHIGHQTVRNYSKLNYTDYKVGATY